MMQIIIWLKLFLARYRDNADGELRRKLFKKYYDIDIGKYTYGYNKKNIAKGSKIGAFCSIATGVKIGLMNHPTQHVSTHPFLYYANRGFVKQNKNGHECGSVIGNDVWIGTNAIILPNVNIGNGAVIGAGAVVTKDVKPFEIVGGVPAKHIKWRFDDENLREKLVQISWYEWPDEIIKDNLEFFYDPYKFVDKFF